MNTSLSDQQRTRLRRQKKRNDRLMAVQQLKSGKPCVGCGGHFPHYVMDFDHRDPTTKVFQVSTALKWNVSWRRIVDEIGKCDLRCANCHRLRSEGKRVAHVVYKTRAWVMDKQLIDGLKESTPCADCARCFRPCQMDFDHVRGHKVDGISRLLGDPRLQEELLKCDLVCANCHRERTWSHLGVRSILEQVPVKVRGKRGPYRNGQPSYRSWHALVGTMPDARIANQAGLSLQGVRGYRLKQGIPVFKRQEVST